MALRVGKNSVVYSKDTFYTKGGQYTVENTGDEYKGPYHLVDGIAFTGPPKSPGTLRLLPFVYDNSNNYFYDKRFKFKHPTKLYKSPKFFRPNPKTSDYELGYMQRHLVTHNLDASMFPIEIAVTQANNFGGLNGIDAGLYTLHTIKWVLTGAIEDKSTPTGIVPGIASQNREAVLAVARRYPLVEFAFRNYTEFARPTAF